MIKTQLNFLSPPKPFQDFEAVGRLLQSRQPAPAAPVAEPPQTFYEAPPIQLLKSGSALPNVSLESEPAVAVPTPAPKDRPRPQVQAKTEAPQQSSAALDSAAQALQAGHSPGLPGPYEVQKIEMNLGGQDVDVYLPKGKGPFPVNIYATGLSHGQKDARANSNHFASWGMITVVPSLKGNMNPVNSGEKMEQIVDDIASKTNLKGVALNPEAIAVSGHSFGGLSASLAADHPKVKALLALDPNDNFLQANPGKRNATEVDVPAAFLFGDGGPNNLGPGIFKGLASDNKYALRFDKMPHLNFASRSQWPDKAGQQKVLAFGTAFLLNQLNQTPGTQAYLPGGSEVQKAWDSGDLEAF